jgi:hypothetical protein
MASFVISDCRGYIVALGSHVVRFKAGGTDGALCVLLCYLPYQGLPDK